MNADRNTTLQSFRKIIALQYLSDGIFCTKSNYVFESHCAKPSAVEINNRFFRIKNFEYLSFECFSILIYFFTGERLAGDGPSGWIAYHSGEITDQENNFMTEILEMFHFAQQNSVAQMQIRSSWIKTGFD